MSKKIDKRLVEILAAELLDRCYGIRQSKEEGDDNSVNFFDSDFFSSDRHTREPELILDNNGKTKRISEATLDDFEQWHKYRSIQSTVECIKLQAICAGLEDLKTRLERWR